MSVSRTPPDSIAGHVARLFVTIIERPADALLDEFLLHENAYVRVPLVGTWETPVDGVWTSYKGPMLFGAQQRRFPVRARGPVIAAGFAIRPGGWFSFGDAPADTMADRLSLIGGDWGGALRWATADVYDIERTFARLEQVLRERIAVRAVPADPVIAAFERIAQVDPLRPVAGIAAEFGMSGRRLDRAVRAHFGHLPKTVLRRSRFLDVAAVMRGLAVPSADELAELRFYDASHLNREFREFVGMTPAQFRRSPTMLFTPGLEVRQQRKRVELAPHVVAAPWRDEGHVRELGA